MLLQIFDRYMSQNQLETESRTDLLFHVLGLYIEFSSSDYFHY